MGRLTHYTLNYIILGQTTLDSHAPCPHFAWYLHYIDQTRALSPKNPLWGDPLPNNVEAKMDGIEEKMKRDMEDFKIDLTKLLQEMLTNGERVLKETHEENKRNVNHDFIDSNIGLKTHHVPKIDMRNFDG